ncbi:MAG TPA: Tex family protein [Kofleriaceae bacterium]|nr:Tex family protein [Kofleriaceae bacterium]
MSAKKTSAALVPRLAADLGLPAAGVAAVCALLDEDATVPFIARYRKEATGGLDEVAIRAIEERRAYLSELEDRRQVVLASIEEQGALTDDLRARILATDSKAELEDLYLPFRPRRRTRAAIARERGLGPLADRILAQPERGDPLAEATGFVDAEKGVPGRDEALAGARDIAAEAVAENADVRAAVRTAFREQGDLAVEVVPAQAEQAGKFQQYFDYREPVRAMPSHRFLAIRRGENEGFLRARIETDDERLRGQVARLVGLRGGSPFAGQLELAVRDSLKRLLAPSIENEVRAELKERSDRGAVAVFAENLRHLLLAAPLGQRSVIGIDPGLRTGCKCAAVDPTGRFLGHVTIYPSHGDSGRERARRELVEFVRRHAPHAIAVGNGTGGRETEAFTREVLRDAGVADLIVVQVSEAGASVYSASDAARDEFPDLDLTVRGAISIARRLQDPLAELVKIEPKAIGVGQYQHDVHQPLLGRVLAEVVESCVNRVGVALNTASAALLSYVAGVSPKVARSIVEHREKRGAFRARADLLAVSGVGPRTFQQCAGFLRIADAAHPLDRSAVHPERYGLVERIAADLGVGLAALVGDQTMAGRIDIRRYVGDGVGEPTLADIVSELAKPGRDPRAAFEPPRFRDDVRELSDLAAGMVLEGVVTNVTAFGAFVDVGVHQDGLVHVSQLSDRFVRDPAEVVKVGDRLTVRVLEVDLARKRISLTARKEGAPAGRGRPPEPGAGAAAGGPKPRKRDDRGDRGAGGGGERDRGEARQFRNNPFATLGDKKRDR